jgi:hypothetical protein
MRPPLRRPAWLTALAGLCLCLPAEGAPEPEPALKPALDSLNSDELLGHIKALSSDAFEGRAPGTPGEEKTVEYLTGQFRSLGLKPGNPDGSYVQEVPLVGTLATAVSGSIAVGGKMIELKHPENWVAVSRRQADRVEVSNSDVVFVGYGVVAPEYGWDDYKGLDTRGKTLVMLVNDPAVPDPKDPSKLDPSMFRGRAMTYYGRWTYKYEIASEKGAAAVILVPRDRPGRLPLRRRPGQRARELRHRHARAGRGARRGRVVGLAREGQGAVLGGRDGPRPAQEGGRQEGLPPRPAGGEGQLLGREHAPAGPLAQRDRAAGGVGPVAQE